MRTVGILCAFGDKEKMAAAQMRLREASLTPRLLAPHHLESMGESDPFLTRVGLVTGLGGAALGFLMCWYASAVAYPIDVGGRPLFSWPNFIPITFVLGVLSASLSLLVAFLRKAGLPLPYHPLFNLPVFDLSQELYYIYVDCPPHDYPKAKEVVATLALSVQEVPA
jgi:hypothetical protein